MGMPCLVRDRAKELAERWVPGRLPGAAKLALEPGLPPTSSADVGYRADDREVAGHADGLVWVRILGSSKHAPLFGGGPVRVGYRAQVEKAFKGAPPAPR
ncbi:hypothetical protein ACFWWM_26020 [Streptomyces sp. NPDC058682]|uniref:hypothetical protein n=1 Tax=Streptomyces sp. NPDC058682 TaxID=3346596 RepID=UPI003668DE55